ncbi:hypothetical protein Tco_0705698 [Tanacetum coccineum]|uniref:Uncharacterized protein n=1 Tax=Tanacetum coccineum TaxID=301880 RepID=A0ABQ4Y684_9ASTR
MNPLIAAQVDLNEALVLMDNRVVTSKSNMRIDPSKTQKEATYQVVLDTLKHSPCYNAFLITIDVPEIYMQQSRSLATLQDLFAYATSFRSALEVPKKARKGSKDASQQKKASSVTASDDSKPKPAKKPTGRRKPAGVVTKDTPDVSKKKTPVQTQKHKGMEMLFDAGGSSDGASSQPEVPDEPKGKSVDTSEGAGSKPEVLDVSEVMTSDQESDNESWGDSEDEDDDDKTLISIKLNLMMKELNLMMTKALISIRQIMKKKHKKMNAKLTNEGKRDEEMTDAEKVDAEHEEANQEKEKTDVSPSSSSKSVSSNYGSIFLNLDNISSVETEIISMLDVQVQQEIPSNQSSSLLIVPVSVIPEPSIIKPILEIVSAALATTIPPPTPLFIPRSQQSTPIPTPITTKATTLTPAVLEFETLSAIHLRVLDLEKEVKELRNIGHSTTLLATIKSEVPSAIKEYLGTSLGDALHKKPQKIAADIRKIKMEHVLKQQESQYTIKSSDKAALNEYDQKQALFETITESKSFNKHPNYKALYHALIESILADEEAIDQSVADLDKQNKRKPVDDDRDEDPLAGLDQGLKRRKTSKDAEPPKRSKSTGSSKGNTSSQLKPKSIGKFVYAEEQFTSDLAKAKKPPLTFNELMRSPIDFSAYARNRLEISNLTKVDLVGPVYNLLKGTCISCVELEYNMEECYKALTDQLD